MSLSIDRDKFQAADKPTLYKQIRLDIERRILTGEWPPGHRIPFEHQLMTRYGCSRMTVSKALSELAQADLIERRRRAGTFVRRPKFLSAVLTIPDIRAEITALGRSYGYQLIRSARRAANAADRERLGVGLRTAGRAPVRQQRRAARARGDDQQHEREPADHSRGGVERAPITPKANSPRTSSESTTRTSGPLVKSTNSVRKARTAMKPSASTRMTVRILRQAPPGGAGGRVRAISG